MARTRLKKGACYATEWCPKCDERLTYNQVMYSSGICPYCGHKGSYTVCDYTVKVYRVLKHQKRILGLFWWTTQREVELVNTYEG